MKKLFFFITTLSALSICVNGQNISPYWSLAGNTNATSTSKLGTVNSIPLSIMTKNVSRIRIDTFGRVGIGTTAPAQVLHVVGHGTISGNLGLGVTNASQKLHVLGNTYISGNLGLGITPTQKLHVVGNGVFTGSVGIGTTAPTAKLHVVGASLFTANLNVTAGGITSTNIGIGVSGESTSGSYGVYGSSNYLGVYGYAPSGTYGVFGYGGTYGVNGSSSNSAYGVYGTSSSSYSANGSTGVYGSAYYGVHGVGTLGIWGEGTSYGLYGTSSGYTGVYANGASYGVIGSGSTGLYGSSSATSGFGVYGYTSGASAYAGYFLSANFRGIYVESDPSWYAGYFVGDVYSTGTFISSDARVKKDIKDFSNAMDIIGQLQPKNYEYRSDGNFASMNLPKGKHYGMLAQDLEKILPNLVKEEKHEFTNKDTRAQELKLTAEGKVPTGESVVANKNETKEGMDLKAVNYTELIPIIVKGMQEQQHRIEELTEINADLKNQVNELKSLILQGYNGSSITSLSGYLKQNIPNPAANATVISYYLPENITHAQIKVTDMKGSILKVYRASGGTGQINITRGELPSGVYNYTLYANNKKLDSKQMVIMK
jgi:hypothetical protein